MVKKTNFTKAHIFLAILALFIILGFIGYLLKVEDIYYFLGYYGMGILLITFIISQIVVSFQRGHHWWAKAMILALIAFFFIPPLLATIIPLIYYFKNLKQKKVV